MLFPTVEYALFFLAVLVIAWSLYRFPEAHKGFLLVASYVFYGFWNWTYIPLLFGISLFSGLVAQRIQRSDSAVARKRWLIAGVIVCLTTLGYYKYTGFLLTNLLGLWGHFAHPPAVPGEEAAAAGRQQGQDPGGPGGDLAVGQVGRQVDPRGGMVDPR